ncbi:MAG: exodeoxyribonuclease VII small subunit [Chloroflexi bacterium]|jgi:exodeoxyribonuclease VII small subunit|nr:exodeoxyribonuclease VII small subunit [Chloroflexota bacterium]
MSAEPESYEVLYARLQEIVRHLEAGELPLAEAMARYEEGVALSRRCRSLLDAAALRVTHIANPTAAE